MLAALRQASLELSAVSRFTDSVLLIFCWMTVILLGVGVNVVRTGEPARLDKPMKIGSFALAGVLGALAIAEWGIKIQAYVSFETDTYDLEEEVGYSSYLLNFATKLDFSFIVIAWALSIATLVRSTMIWLPSRVDKRLDWSLLFLMLCCGALLFRTTYDLIYQLKFVDFNDIQHAPPEPAYIELIEIVFHTWSIFTIVVMLLVLGAKKRGGLWSTQQPFLQNSEAGDSQDIPLEDINVDPPAYSAAPGSNNRPPAGAVPPAGIEAAAAHPNPRLAGPEPWQQAAPQNEPADDDLVDGLGLGSASSHYRPPVPQDDGYNSGIVAPMLPAEAEAGPAGGYGMGISSQPPPEHEEVMGLNHQADGRPPISEPLPYPEKN
ncbi:uncharacterized protein J7T54_006617 [Emericellopsis cladophorae]|uniref:Uncharacterized protein n=1 Tax=Emericellopsis cladophorae TaxID=2686198 RepID=A0A9P9Y6V8_9HYPO|nr:uncharacterized protein J7T54_006617 [Emericellopsis cladophorae]KAI6784572.1 hypothetical protein J7T54_006617 [Emericellopsis cladophorae]